MKSPDVPHRSLPAPTAFVPARRVAPNLTERWDCLIASALNSSQDSLRYVVIADLDCLVRYHRDEAFRESIRAAATVLCASWSAAILVYLLRGVWPGLADGNRLIRDLLKALRPDERIVWIGGRRRQTDGLTRDHSLENVRHYRFAKGTHDPQNLQDCVDFIERQTPFRICVLAIESPQSELMAHALLLRGLARGAVICVGELPGPAKPRSRPLS